MVFLLYLLSKYIVLWFSRTREYHADRFAGEVTGKPGDLSSALVKIAYGLVEARPLSEDEGEEEDEEEDAKVRPDFGAVGALGIFDSSAALSIAVTGFTGRNEGVGGEVNKEALRGAMRWDLWNPWAKWYELSSTHPLVANRLRHLSNQAVHLGVPPYITFDERKPESYWNEFFIDLPFVMAPLLIVIGTIISLLAGLRTVELGELTPVIAVGLILFGVARLVENLFISRGGHYAPMSVSALLKKVKVSPLRPVRCEVRGKIIGRGVPGLIISEDLILRDETGIIFLDHD